MMAPSDGYWLASLFMTRAMTHSEMRRCEQPQLSSDLTSRSQLYLAANLFVDSSCYNEANLARIHWALSMNGFVA